MCDQPPETAKDADEICLVRSMNTESVDHESALRRIHRGKFLAVLPARGLWVVSTLGADNSNLPAYVVLGDPGGLPVDGERNWSSGFLPAFYQGTAFRSGPSPVFKLQPPGGVGPNARRNQLKLLDELNRRHHERHPENTELAARIASVETAARMQASVPEALDLSSETEATHKRYGLDNPATMESGTRCLLAR